MAARTSVLGGPVRRSRGHGWGIGWRCQRYLLSGVDGLLLWAEKKKSKGKFISGEAGVINAGVCRLIEPAFISILGDAGGPLCFDVSHGNGWLITAKEIWVRATTSPGQHFRSQGSVCAPWHKCGPRQASVPGGSAASSSACWKTGWGEKEGSATMSDIVTASPRSWIPKDSKSLISRTILRVWGEICAGGECLHNKVWWGQHWDFRQRDGLPREVKGGSSSR